MNTKLLIFSDGLDEHEYKLIQYPKTVDFQEAWNKIITQAKAENFVGPLSNLPNEYYHKQNLYPIPCNVYEHPNTYLKPKRKYEDYGISPVNCYDCICCHDGYCSKYDGVIDSSTDYESCIRGNDILELLHNNTHITFLRADLDSLPTIPNLLPMLDVEEFPEIQSLIKTGYQEEDIILRPIDDL